MRKNYTYKIILSYDGSRFYGSARQPDKHCVQNALENALKCLGVFAPSLFASRTDKGVHARCSVARISAPYKLDCAYAKAKLNRALQGIRVQLIKPCEFEPRFDAKMRSYRYVISSSINAFDEFYKTFYPGKIDIEKLRCAAKLFEGEHDFAAFCLSLEPGKSTVRKIYKTRVYSRGSLVIFNFYANGFLRGQIRLMMDFLLKINEGKLSCEHLLEQLQNRKIHSRTLAPANGLYLKSIVY